MSHDPLPHIPPVFPLSPPSEAEALEDYHALRALDMAEVWREGEWSSRSDVPGPHIPLLLGMSRAGAKASNRYHFAARMACESNVSPSPVRSWYCLQHRASLEGSQYYEASPAKALNLRKYVASPYRPAAALAQIRAFGARRVYDPCGGWGDRLLAALAADIEVYYARDVNPNVFIGYSEQVRAYPSSTRVCVEYKQAEVDAPAENYFDLVMTSPPYWKTEKYAGDLSSHALYRSFHDWLKGFCFPMMRHAATALAPGGHALFTVSDVYANHTLNRICLPMVETAPEYGLMYVGALGYGLGKRINHRNEQSKAAGFGEPVLVFRKE